MLKIICFILVFCGAAFAKDVVPEQISLAPGDTVFVIGGSVVLPGWKMIDYGHERKINIACSTIGRDSTGALVKTAYRVRLFGVDTSKVEIRHIPLSNVTIK